ncbi:hypothetical protein [Maribacter sp. 2210JD10-5]|uniref:hypothetical protein n=1 Tax=Maribacter sp. 2210JD10-5 TaxID=3386272 RepID=UPI0039BD717F
MITHFQFTDDEFEQKFEKCELSPELFTHEAHLRLAWIHINKYGIQNALTNILQQIQDYVNNLGVTDKYNMTLTTAAVKAVHHFNLKSESDTFMAFTQEFPRLLTNFKDLINTHYSFDIFDSYHAKTIFLEPDLLPFD